VAVVHFWTYTCINWLRQLPHLCARAGKYSGQVLVVIGVHTPEFSFEHNADNARRAVQEMGITTRQPAANKGVARLTPPRTRRVPHRPCRTG
jgi:hypothetical protein